MACLLDCPAELRQQILSYTLPDDVHNAGVAPRTAPLLPLLLTCRTIRLDVLELLRTWSPLYHIHDPAAITTTTTSCRRLDEDGPHMRRISLRLFAGLDLRRMRSWPIDVVEGVFDVDPWLRCVSSLPRTDAAAVESVTVDLTPVPAWMVAKRPDWVRGTVLDARNRAFLEGCAEGVRKLVRALCWSYGDGVRVRLGGMVPRKARRAVEGMMVEGSTEGHPAKFVGFEGEWLSGPSEVPTRLSLPLVCGCWGLEVRGPSVRVNDWRYDQKMIRIRNEARKEGLTKPEELYFKPQMPVLCWSRNSCTAYYVNAQEDEKRTREDLLRLLVFAVDVKTEVVPQDATIDFAPAIRSRRFLLHCLAKDLGLSSVSVGDAGEKFVRVSRVVEVAAGEQESLESSGNRRDADEEEEENEEQEEGEQEEGEQEEGEQEEGEQEEGEQEEEGLSVRREEDPTSSIAQATRLRRPCRTCCIWGPIKQLLRAAGDR